MNWKKIGEGLRNGFFALINNELLLRLKLDKYFVHIIYTFFLAFMMILIGMRVENTMTKVENSKTVLNDMKIYHAQKTVELVKAGRLGNIEKLLEDKGSDVTMPEKPAYIIKKK